MRTMKERIEDIYTKLYSFFGPQHWWPGDTPLEVAVGAVLTQNTNWGNVEKAIENLKSGGKLNPRAIHAMSDAALADCLRPAGYFNIKAQRLKNFVGFLMSTYGGDMLSMKKEKVGTVRDKLLSVNGIGPETADSIILYALEKPVFVIDAYTKRILSRHSIALQASSYETLQNIFHSVLKEDVKLYNEYHALFVRLAKEYCRTVPLCTGCPLEGM